MADIERVHRSVIESKLLVALNDDSKCAILVDEKDLQLLIDAVRLQAFHPAGDNQDPDEKQKVRDFLVDMEQLKRESFGE